jgi:hypothetical protein
MTEYGASATIVIVLFLCGLTYCGNPDLHDIMLDRLTTEELCEK